MSGPLRRWLLCLFWGCLPVGALAQPGTPLEQALLRLDFAAADRLAATEADPLRKVFARHHTRFVRAIATPSPPQTDAFQQAFASAEAAYEQLPEQPLRRALQAELYWERAILKVLEQRHWSAFWDIRKAHHLAEAELRHYPRSIQPLRLLGLMEAEVASLPGAYRFAANVLGLSSGQVARGLGRLRQAAGQAEVLPAESTLLLHYIQRQLAPESLPTPPPMQVFFAGDTQAAARRYSWAQHLLDQRQAQAAAQLLSRTPPAGFAYWHHAAGKAALFFGRNELAIAQFRLFLRHSQARMLRRDAQFRLGQALLLNGQAAAARAAFAAVDTLPPAGFDDDIYATRQARRYAANLPTGADLALLRARLAFDGGETATAFAVLKAVPVQPLTLDQRTEYHYRMGRLYDEAGETAAAQAAYLASEQSNPPNAHWMVAYSRYYLGRLAERAGQSAQARLWYERAMTYPGDEYRMGLEQKVKAALQRVGT